MATNGATKRLLKRFPEIESIIVEIADDVFAVPEASVTLIRERLADQPQVLYFLDRDIRADEFFINALGDRGWALRRASAPVVAASALVDQAFIEKGVALGSLDPTAVYTGVSALSLKGTAQTAVGDAWAEPTGSSIAYPSLTGLAVSGTRTTLGPYPVGDCKQFAKTGNTDFTWSPASSDYDRAVHDWNGVVTSQNHYTYGTVSCAAVPKDGTVSTRGTDALSIQLRTNLVVIAGPAVCEYAEFFPGFEWVIGDFPEVALRIKAVLDAVPASGKADPSYLKAIEAVEDMRKKTGTKLVAFRGSSEWDPVRLWSDTRVIPNVSFATVPAEEGYVSQAELSAAREAWAGSRWMLSGYNANDPSSFVDLGALGVDPGEAFTVKASAANEVHVGTEEGVSAITLDKLSDVVKAIKKVGATVSWDTTSPWLTNPAFGITLYNDAKSVYELWTPPASDPTGAAAEPAAVDNTDYGSFLGGALCSRLLAKPSITAEEELIIIPALSPQYFWSRYAREAADVLVPDSPPVETVPV